MKNENEEGKRMSTPKEWEDFYKQATELLLMNAPMPKAAAQAMADAYNQGYDDAIIEIGKLRRE